MFVSDVGFIAFYLGFLLSEPGDHWIGKVGWPLAFRDSPMSTAPLLQLQTCIGISGFSLSARDPNLGPYAHAADTLLNKPPSQSQHWASLRHFHTCIIYFGGVYFSLIYFIPFTRVPFLFIIQSFRYRANNKVQKWKKQFSIGWHMGLFKMNIGIWVLVGERSKLLSILQLLWTGSALCFIRPPLKFFIIYLWLKYSFTLKVLGKDDI